MADDDGRSLLHLAASRGHTDICRLLFESGASPGVVDRSGRGILAEALGSGSMETAALCKEYLGSIRPNGQRLGQEKAIEEGAPDRQDARTNSPSLPNSIDLGPNGVPSSGFDQACNIAISGDSEFPGSSFWEVLEELPLPGCRDETCLSSAESMHSRITRHRTIDSDEDWSDIEIILPVLRRGNLQFSGLNEETLTWVSRLLSWGSLNGWVPSHWLLTASALAPEPQDRQDLYHRFEMLLGEYGIQVEDEPAWLDIPIDEGEAEASDVPPEVLAFIDDLGPGTRDPLLAYFHDLSSLPLLDWDEERALGHLWQRDRDPEGIRGLVEGNLRFVVKEARRYQGLGLDIQDLVSAGNLGLIAGAMRFDPGRENRFLTYAAWWIKQSIFHALAEIGRRIRLPQKVAGNVVQLNRILGRLTDGLGREPTLEEILAEGTFSGRELDRLLTIKQSEITTAADENDYNWHHPDNQTPARDPSPEEDLDANEFKAQMKSLLAALDRRERVILTRHYGLGCRDAETLESIGQSFKPPISRERVRQIEERTFSRIRSRWGGLLEPYLGEPRQQWHGGSPSMHPLQEDGDDAQQV